MSRGNASVFVVDSAGSMPQPGILPPQLSNMAFIVITLKDSLSADQHDQVKSALVAGHNNQKGPTDTVKNEGPCSLYAFATRTNNLLSTESVHFSIGFSHNLWVNKWKMGSTPNGFRAFKDWNNKYDGSRKPFQDTANPLQRKYYDGAKYSIPAERKSSDICIQIKSASRALIDRVCAHALLLLDQYSQKFEIRHGVCRQRDQFGFHTASSNVQITDNPTLDSGPVVRVWNNEECENSKAKRAKYGDQYVDLGRIPTTFIGDETDDETLVNGTFGVLGHFVHDVNAFNKLAVDGRDRVFGRTKEAADPKKGTLNQQLPHSHIVRTHIRGQKVLKSERGTCPFQWLRPSEHQHNQYDDGKDQELEVEASSVPIRMYRQDASFQNTDGLQGLHLFGYSRDCAIMDEIFQRMIGQQSSFPNWPEKEKELDPVLGSDGDTKYHAVDQLLWYTKATECQYYFFPNLQTLLNLQTSMMPNSTPLAFPVRGYMEDGSTRISDDIRRFLAVSALGRGAVSMVKPAQSHEIKEDDDAKGDDVEPSPMKGLRVPKSDMLKSLVSVKAISNRDSSMGLLHGDLSKRWMLDVAQTDIGAVWKQRAHHDPASMEGVDVVIVGAGISGLCAGHELKKMGVNVKILEATEVVGGRLKTLRFAYGNHAEAGAMRLPGSPDPRQRTISHWLTDFYIEHFDLEVAPFNNKDYNTPQRMRYTASVTMKRDIKRKIREWTKEDFEGWDAEIKRGIKQLGDPKPRSPEHEQLKLLMNIKDLNDYQLQLEAVVLRSLAAQLDTIEEEYNNDPRRMAKYDSYIKAAENAWDRWTKMWSKYTYSDFLKQPATAEELEFLGNIKGLQTGKSSFVGLRPCPPEAIHALHSFHYMPSPANASLVVQLRDGLGKWNRNPMHTLRDGMDVLPRSFVDPNLWGPQCQSNEKMTLAEQVVYSNEVFKVDYSAAAKGGKVKVYARHTVTKEVFEYECDYCIVSVPLPIVQYFDFEPPLSQIKQEAVRSTRYEQSTKVCLEFRERFWAVDVEKGEEFNRPALPDDIRIEGGHSVTTGISSQIVYPTPRNYVPKGDEPYIDWDFSDTRHSDDHLKSGILVSYTWGKEAERLSAFDRDTAFRTVLRDIADLHSVQRYPENEEKRDLYRKRIIHLFSCGEIEAWGQDSKTAGAFVLWAPFQYEDYLDNLMNWPQGLINFDDRRDEGAWNTAVKELWATSPPKIKAFLKRNQGDLKNWTPRKFNVLQDNRVYFCGEAISWCNGWIQGALESAVLTSYQLFDSFQILKHDNYLPSKITKPRK